MATNKMQRQYRVTNGYNPVTKKKILRPVITNRKKMNLDQIVEYCLNAGFVRGQFHDMRGNLNGFIEGMKQLGQDGHDLYLDDWFRIHAEFTDGHQKYEPIEEFKNLDDGAEIEFAFFTRGGIKDAPEKVSRRTATLLALKEPKMVSFTQLNAAGNVESEGLLTNLYSKLEIKAKNIPEGVKGRYAVYSKSTGELLADTKWDPNPLDTTFERVSDTLIRAEFKRNSTPEPDGTWYEVGNPVKFELLLPDGTVISTPITIA